LGGCWISEGWLVGRRMGKGEPHFGRSELEEVRKTTNDY